MSLCEEFRRTRWSLELSAPRALEPSRRPGQAACFVLHCVYFLFPKILKLHHDIKMLFPTTPRDWGADGFIGDTRTEGSVGHHLFFKGLTVRQGLDSVDLLWGAVPRPPGSQHCTRDRGHGGTEAAADRVRSPCPGPQACSLGGGAGQRGGRLSVCDCLSCGFFIWSGVRAGPASRCAGGVYAASSPDGR